jgi:hypothetical protein
MKFTVFIFLLLSNIVTGQRIVRSTIGTSGHSNSGGKIFIQHSIGQPSLTTNEFNDINKIGISQGFQQSINLLSKNRELQLFVYPNPNNGKFYFKPPFNYNEFFTYQIIDPLGKLIFNKSGQGNIITEVDLNLVAPGAYYLQVRSINITLNCKIIIYN